ncbi:hypothetical protein F3Y22_tig00110676pilonHSYRG00201 [Hibiscus syriacus]|uniref:Thioredoxin domain-containing protein n=1 Tax=Hibiscus syriacus TaxID=106335 RepID=A0A6A2ZX69_HIBSY|nr:hypothetical protein F3Y22_tig00110676pilonHSYRG00201 [Hibiscus syriacus]
MAAEEGQVIACHTLQAWNEQLQKCNESKKLDVAADWAVEAMPTFMFLREGKILGEVGAQKDELQQTVKAYGCL